MEDIKKTANEQAAEETKEAVKVVTDSDTPEGAYVHAKTLFSMVCLPPRQIGTIPYKNTTSRPFRQGPGPLSPKISASRQRESGPLGVPASLPGAPETRRR